MLSALESLGLHQKKDFTVDWPAMEFRGVVANGMGPLIMRSTRDEDWEIHPEPFKAVKANLLPGQVLQAFRDLP